MTFYEFFCIMISIGVVVIMLFGHSMPAPRWLRRISGDVNSDLDPVIQPRPEVRSPTPSEMDEMSSRYTEEAVEEALARYRAKQSPLLAESRPQTGTAPDEQTEMRYPTRASELDHRRLQVPPSLLHDSSTNQLHAGARRTS
jgi:hypothetical protein